MKHSMSCNINLLIATSKDGTSKALLIDMKSNQVQRILTENSVETPPIYGCFSPDEKWLVVVSSSEIHCLDVRSKRLLHTWPHAGEDDSVDAGEKTPFQMNTKWVQIYN